MMISVEKILANIMFFQKCEMDYKILAESLIKKLAHHLEVKIDYKLPLRTFKPFYITKQSGTLDDWTYFFHGHHCCFENSITQQEIEVSLVNGKKFGTLDPVFFLLYILSTKAYEPIPIKISKSFTEGTAILHALKIINQQKLIITNN